jgi:hypothetical protein
MRKKLTEVMDFTCHNYPYARADAIIAALPEMIPNKDVAFLSWWNETHDIDFHEHTGMYERHAKKCFDAGYTRALAAFTGETT